MANGRPGDDPYLDMVSHGLDLGEPEITARLRAIDATVSLDVRKLLSDLVSCAFLGPGSVPDDYRRERLLGHLTTIERLCFGRGDNS